MPIVMSEQIYKVDYEELACLITYYLGERDIDMEKFVDDIQISMYIDIENSPKSGSVKLSLNSKLTFDNTDLGSIEKFVLDSILDASYADDSYAELIGGSRIPYSGRLGDAKRDFWLIRVVLAYGADKIGTGWEKVR
jgi:hypothetical protein